MSLFLIETAFKASFVLGVAGVANMLLRRRQSAASRHLVWTLAVAGLLALPLLSASLPRWDIRIPVATPTVAAGVPIVEPVGSDLANFNTAAAVGATPDSPAVAAAAEPAVRTTRVAWIALLPAMYMAGVLLLLVRLLRERLIVSRLARRAVDVANPEWTRLLAECAAQIGVRRPVRLLRSLERSMPMAFGIGRPSILIPSLGDTWSAD